MNTRRNNITKKILAWLGTALLFLAALEICARLDDYLRWGAPLWRNYSQLSLSVDDENGRRGRPGGRFQKWSLNSLGLRGPELAAQKPAGQKRILVLGASETFGLYEPPGGEFPARLQAILDQRAPGRYLVINAGFPGMSLPRLKFYYQKDLAKLKPDMVIIYPSPAFYLDIALPRDPAKHKFDLPGRPVFESRLWGKVWIIIKRLVPQSWQNLMRRAVITWRRRGKGGDYVWQKLPQKRMEIYKRDLAGLVELVRQSRAKAILTTHATRFGPNLGPQDTFHLYAWLLYYPRVNPAVMLSMERSGNQEVMDLAGKLKAPLVDLDGILKKSPAHFADFSHFTGQGAKAVARALAKEVLALDQRP